MITHQKKIWAFLFALFLSLSLCNTETVFATERISTPIVSQQSDSENAADTPTIEEIPMDSAEPAQELSDEMPLLANSISMNHENDWKEVATVNELKSLLKDKDWMNAGGHIRVTDDLVILEDDYCNIEPKTSADMPLVVDLGIHTLYVEGEFQSSGNTKYIGDGGKNGLIHIRTGGSANIRSAVFEVTGEDGYAIWQEEGSLFRYSSAENTVGKVHFAQSPVAIPFSSISPDVATPVVVVHDGQTLEDVLPKTDSVRLYWQGVMDQGTGDEDKLIPVEWDLKPYQAQLDAGERVLITGSYTEAVAFEIPVCLVVFQNGNPATFLNVYGAQSYNGPVANVNVELAEPELGCRFEWSLDGGTWFSAKADLLPSDGTLLFTVSFPQVETASYPYYLSAVVDYPDGRQGYSDVVVFTKSDRVCDAGGNRGGGIDITDPPNVLPPLPPEDASISGGLDQEQESAENADGDESESVESDSTPDPEEPESLEVEAWMEPEQESAIVPAEDTSVAGQSSQSARKESDRQASTQIGSETVEQASDAKPDDTETGIPEVSDPAPSNPTGETLPAETMPARTEEAEHTPSAKAIPIVVGTATTATVVGAAGIYHSVGLRRRLWDILKQLIRIKK